MNVWALVFLSAVVAAAVARPGPQLPVQSPIPGASSSKTTTARTNSNQEANVDDINVAQTGTSLQNPAPGSLETSRPVNPELPDSLSDGSDDSIGIRIVDNPHIGLPFGAVLPLPAMASARVSPTPSTEDASNTFRIDSPHVGLPPIVPAFDPPASITIARSITGVPQTGSSSDGTFGNSNIPTEVPPKSNGVSNLLLNTSPASSTDNKGGQPKSQFANCVNPGFPKVFIPNRLPANGTSVFVPVSSPIPHITSSAGPLVRSYSNSLPTNNGNSDFLVNNPFGGTFTKFSNSPSPIYTPNGSPNQFFRSFSVNRAPSHIRVNTDSRGFPNSSPNTYPLTNIAFTTNNPYHSLPINTSPSETRPFTNLLVNSANVLLFNENIPCGYVVNTAQGPVLVGGPYNVAIFPKQPSLDDINQVLLAHSAQAVPTAPAAGGPAFRPSAATTA